MRSWGRFPCSTPIQDRISAARPHCSLDTQSPFRDVDYLDTRDSDDETYDPDNPDYDEYF